MECDLARPGGADWFLAPEIRETHGPPGRRPPTAADGLGPGSRIWDVRPGRAPAAIM